MKHYVSVSQFPGKTGQYYYTKFFEHYNLSADYTPIGISDKLSEFIQQQKTLASGISVSMPFKSRVIDYLDELDISAIEYGSVNTITINNGITRGYNADLAGVEYTCNLINKHDRIIILGSGAMAKMFFDYLKTNGYSNVKIAARNTAYNSWHNRFNAADVIINCTALGTSSSESPYKIGQMSPDVRMVIDLAIKDNEFAKQCADKSVKYINGTVFYREQFLRQFEIYTGIKPDAELFDKFERQLHEKI